MSSLPTAGAQRPNFLVILTDQQRGDGLGCAWPEWRAAQGETTPLQTPNLDRLAQGGVKLSRAYVNCPLCMPGRSSLITGLTPRAHMVRTNGINLDRGLPTITQALTDAGYRTHSVGKTHFRITGVPKGVDPQTLDPLEWPESAWMWAQGKLTKFPEPYYGIQTLDWTGGHGNVGGDYRTWLRSVEPAAAGLLAREAGEAPASGAEQSWKMAIPPELHYNTWVADRTISFLEGVAGGAPAARLSGNDPEGGPDGDGRQPFLCFASFPDPHHPFATPDPWYSMYDRGSVPAPVRREGELAELAPFFREVHERGVQLAGRGRATRMPDEQVREITAITYGMISFVDQQVGRILDTLERLGLADDTVVVFTADHGDLLGDHWLMNKGPFHFDGLLRVPGIWRYPRAFQPGVTSSALTSHLDFAPTVLDLAGVPQQALEASALWAAPGEPEAPDQLRPLPGRSLVPLLSGEVDRVQDAVLVEND